MINALYLMGKLQDDPVVDVYEQTGDSTTYTKFVLVNGPDRGKVTKIAVIAAGLVAQITAGLKKGQQVLVIGKLQTFTWDDGDGTKEKTSVDAHEVYPIGMQCKQ